MEQNLNFQEKIIDQDIINLIPKTYAQNKALLIFEVDENKKIAKVAMVNPLDLTSIEYLRFKLGLEIEPYLTSETSLIAGLNQYPKEITQTLPIKSNKILKPLDLKVIGLSTRNLKLIKESIKNTHGLILITGPKESGKTTTLYSIIKSLNTPKINISTIENQIEHHIPRIKQTEISSSKIIDFSAEFRHLLLEKPHLIMISDLSNPEISELVINSATHDNLILSTSDNENAVSALSELINLGHPNFILASALEMIIAQQLVKKICSVCLESYKIDISTETKINNQLKLIYEKTKNKVKTDDYFYQGRGCSACNFTGLNGVIAIFEVLKINPAIKDLISENAPVEKIREKAIKTGMITLFEDAFLKSREGIITIDEVLKLAPAINC